MGTKAPWKADLRAVCSATWEPALQDKKNMCKGPGRQGWWLVFTGAAERVRGRVQRRQGTAEIPTQREEIRECQMQKRTFGSDNEKIGKSLDSQMILILFNPKEVTNYKIQLLKFK